MWGLCGHIRLFMRFSLRWLLSYIRASGIWQALYIRCSLSGTRCIDARHAGPPHWPPRPDGRQSRSLPLAPSRRQLLGDARQARQERVPLLLLRRRHVHPAPPAPRRAHGRAKRARRTRPPARSWAGTIKNYETIRAFPHGEGFLCKKLWAMW